RMQSSQPHIWAAGDVAGIHLFTFSAWEQGEAAGWNATSGETRRLDYGILPRATFCDPEVGSVGLTEGQARERGFPVKTGRWEFARLPRAIIGGETEGFVKVVADADTGRILGGHVIGAEASTLVHEIAMAMKCGLTAAECGRMLHAYPTLSEGVRWAFQEAV
ncbi:MAG: dihydrolipoyl dehydrogenase, partial [Chloroflexi bacterium]|nr:dihydrolipoyl dehydrogenase [Chloroflexota bacterium]